MPEFQVDEMVIMHSPFTDEDTLVSYRGKNWNGEAVVYNKATGWQGAVPLEWLRKAEEA